MNRRLFFKAAAACIAAPYVLLKAPGNTRSVPPSPLPVGTVWIDTTDEPIRHIKALQPDGTWLTIDSYRMEALPTVTERDL